MRISRLILAAALALLGTTPLRADSYGIGGVGNNAGAPSAPTVTLKGTHSTDAEVVDVFYGRFRPYWRGYYHGSAGYAPRPHLLYGPVVYPRYYGYRSYYRPAYAGVAYAVPCSGGTSFAASGAGPMAGNSDPLAVVPSRQTVVSNYRYDNGQPANGLLPPQTIEPPVAQIPSVNRVQASPAPRPVGYVAYGESIETPRKNAELVRR